VHNLLLLAFVGAIIVHNLLLLAFVGAIIVHNLLLLAFVGAITVHNLLLLASVGAIIVHNLPFSSCSYIFTVQATNLCAPELHSKGNQQDIALINNIL
jgi:hypothetical protein